MTENRRPAARDGASDAAAERRSHDLRATGVTLAYGEHTVARDLDVVIPDGKVTSIIGPNGCGKSTLLRALSRLLAPQEGTVTLDGVPLAQHRPKPLARVLGLLPQQPVAPEGITVADLVGRGRSPHQGLFGRWTRRDHEVVAAALADTDTTELADRCVDELSGGQRQRVWIAMAIAQETDILLLDEPTTFLDVANQLEVLDLMAEHNRRRGTTVVMVLHDMNMAGRYSDHLVAMRAGSVVATGTPDEVLTPGTLRDVFGIDSEVLVDPVSGTPLVSPRGLGGPHGARKGAAR